MPQTAAGSSILAKMVARYGSKKGKNVFYATANSNKKFAKAAGETSVWNRGHKK